MGGYGRERKGMGREQELEEKEDEPDPRIKQCLEITA